MKILASLTLIGLMMIIPAQIEKENVKVSVKGQKAYEKLLDARYFSLGGNSYSGKLLEEELALIELLREENAVEILTKLTKEGTPEGAIFGLVGLKCKDKEAYEKQLNYLQVMINLTNRKQIDFVGNELVEIEIPDGDILILSGCLLSSIKYNLLISQIHSGFYNSSFDCFSFQP